MAVKYKTEIKIEVGLDENRIPEIMKWYADDGGIFQISGIAIKPAGAMTFSLSENQTGGVGGWDVTLTATGNTLHTNVNGVAADDLTWYLVVNYYPVLV